MKQRAAAATALGRKFQLLQMMKIKYRMHIGNGEPSALPKLLVLAVTAMSVLTCPQLYP